MLGAQIHELLKRGLCRGLYVVPSIEPFKGDARRLAHGPSGMEVSSVLGSSGPCARIGRN